MQLKYGPWRNALVEQRISMASKRKRSQQKYGCLDVPGRARMLVGVMKATCRQMHASDEDAAWVESLGRNISHVSGPLATMSRLAILHKAKKNATGFKHLDLGRDRVSRRVCSGREESVVAQARVEAQVRLADAIGAPPGPRTARNGYKPKGSSTTYSMMRVYWQARGTAISGTL